MISFPKKSINVFYERLPIQEVTGEPSSAFQDSVSLNKGRLKVWDMLAEPAPTNSRQKFRLEPQVTRVTMNKDAGLVNEVVEQLFRVETVLSDKVYDYKILTSGIRQRSANAIPSSHRRL